jgi:hypothetical protein
MIRAVRTPAPVEYHVVYPPESFCTIVETYLPIEQECQFVTIEDPPEFWGEWHLITEETNIHVGTGSPAEQSTWGAIKSFFRNLF